MTIWKRLLAGALAALCMTPLGGCGVLFSDDTEALMRPPRPTGDKTGIHEVIEKAAGEGFTFKYPASGDVRSAIVMQDITGDGVEEAIAFYQKAEASSAGVNIMFISKRDGVWTSMGSFAASASQVDKVMFGDVNEDGLPETVVGWGSGQSGVSNVSVYSLSEDGTKLEETVLDQSYAQLLVLDLDGDGFEEIFTATVTVGDQPAQARLFRLRSGAIEILSSCPIDSAVTSIVSAAGGLIGENRMGVLLDGSKAANSYITEVVYWDKGKRALVSPFFDPATQTVEITTRSLNVVSRDVNGDKILELPMVNLLPGVTASSPPDTAYLTDWHQYDAETNTVSRVMSMVTNSVDGYWFLIPDMWKNQITTEQDLSSRTLTFRRWLTYGDNLSEGRAGDRLLEIRVFTAKQWAEEEPNGEYFKILDNNNLVYAGRIPSPDNSLAMSENDVRNSFKLLTQE